MKQSSLLLTKKEQRHQANENPKQLVENEIPYPLSSKKQSTIGSVQLASLKLNQSDVNSIDPPNN